MNLRRRRGARHHTNLHTEPYVLCSGRHGGNGSGCCPQLEGYSMAKRVCVVHGCIRKVAVSGIVALLCVESGGSGEIAGAVDGSAFVLVLLALGLEKGDGGFGERPMDGSIEVGGDVLNDTDSGVTSDDFAEEHPVHL